MVTYLRLKIQSIPAITVFAFAGLLLGMCLYFGPLETYAPITIWYHTALSSDFWRHLLVRAAPETMFAAWFAQCVAIITVVDGQLKKHYRIMHTHELFWRPFLGLIAAIPGSAAMAGLLYLWNKYGIGSRVHSAAKGFCHAGTSGHCLSHHTLAVINSHPGVWTQLEQATLLDGQKKLIVLAGSFVFAIWLMKQYFWNVQGWIAEDRIIEIDAKNKARAHKNKNALPYIRLYHHLVPGLMLRVKYIADKHCVNGQIIEDDAELHLHNHRPVNNAIYTAFRWVVIAGILGGLYIMFFIAQHQYLHLSVVH